MASSAELRVIKREIRDAYSFLRGIDAISTAEKNALDDNMDELTTDLTTLATETIITDTMKTVAQTDAAAVKTAAAALPSFTKIPAAVSETAVTRDTFTNELDWDCGRCKKKAIIIENTDAADHLEYRIKVRTTYDGVDWTHTEDTELPDGEMAKIEINEPYERIYVDIMSTVPEALISFKIEACGVSRK